MPIEIKVPANEEKWRLELEAEKARAKAEELHSMALAIDSITRAIPDMQRAAHLESQTACKRVNDLAGRLLEMSQD